MKIKTRSLVAFVVILLLAQATPSWAKLSPQDMAEISSLRTELSTIKTAELSLVKQEQYLKARKVTLIETDKLLKGAVKNLSKDIKIHNVDAANNRSQSSRYRAGVDKLREEILTHNASCGGSSSYRSHVNACNSRAGRLNARKIPYARERTRLSTWSTQINDRKKTLDMRNRGLKKQRLSLNKAVLGWGKKVKTLNAGFRDLNTRSQQTTRKINSLLFNQSFMNDLKNREEISRRCKEIAVLATMSALERAHRCLQKIWDGAR